MQTMSDKIEQMQQARSEPVAFGHLEDRIVRLVERLDASDSRLGHLEAVERGLTDLLVHIEDLRANKQFSALRAEDTSGVDALKQDVARTQSTVEAMHGTLGQVVERLTAIEKDIRSDTPAHAAAERRHPRADAAGRQRSGPLLPLPTPPKISASAGVGHSMADIQIVPIYGGTCLPAASEPAAPALRHVPIPPASLAPIE